MSVFSAVALGCGLAIGYEGQSQTAQAASPLKPFTAHQTETGFPGAENAPPVVTESSLARRSDGSWVHSYEVTSPLGERGMVVEFLDLRSRVFVHPSPFLKSKMTSHLSESELPGYIQSAFETCDGREKDKSLPRSVMLGFSVVRLVRDLQFGIETAWVAPELDCYQMESSILFRSGSRNETKVTSVQEGEPPDSLFQVPQDFVERSPEDQEALHARKYPGSKRFGDELLGIIGPRYRAHQLPLK
jgi:hypothetical protein